MATVLAFVLKNDGARANAARAIAQAPPGSRVEIRGPRRSNDQSALFHAMCDEAATRALLFGMRYSPLEWKRIFADGVRGESTYTVPSLNGDHRIVMDTSTAAMTREEMSDVIELMHAWGAEHGVTFSNPADMARGAT